MNEKSKILAEVRKMFNLMKRCTQHEMEIFNNNELTPVQWMVLGYISETDNKELYQRDIELAFNIRRSTVSSIIQTIEEKGFIERQSVKDDARLKKLVLTDKSKKMRDTLMNRIELLEEKMTKGITKDEFAMFYRVIEKINHNLED